MTSTKEQLYKYMKKRLEDQDMEKLRELKNKPIKYTNWQDRYAEVKYLVNAQIQGIGSNITEFVDLIGMHGDMEDELANNGLLDNKQISEFVDLLKKESKNLHDSIIQLLYIKQIMSHMLDGADSAISEIRDEEVKRTEERREETKKRREQLDTLIDRAKKVGKGNTEELINKQLDKRVETLEDNITSMIKSKLSDMDRKKDSNKNQQSNEDDI